jgi:hypothetical protein
MPNVKELTDFNPDGTRFGQSTSDKVAFYGATPVVQPSMTLSATTAIGTTTISQVGTTGKWAFATSTAAKALVTRCQQMQANLETLVTRLETLGLMAVSGN